MVTLMEDAMYSQTTSNSSPAESNTWTWIFLVVLLVAGAITAVGALALINAAQQTEVPTGSQTLPSRR
jgi:amino acid permease